MILSFKTYIDAGYNEKTKETVFAVRADRILSMRGFTVTHYAEDKNTETDGTLIVYGSENGEPGSQFVLGEPQSNIDLWLNLILVDKL